MNETKPINRNALIALISAVMLEEHPGSTIVTDSITSEGLAQFIQNDLKGTQNRLNKLKNENIDPTKFEELENKYVILENRFSNIKSSKDTNNLISIIAVSFLGASVLLLAN